MPEYIPDYQIIILNDELNLNLNSNKGNDNWIVENFNSVLSETENSNFLCKQNTNIELSVDNYIKYINIRDIIDKNYEIYLVVDNNYYDEITDEEHYNPKLKNIIYGISFVRFEEEMNTIYVELLCKNYNPDIPQMNYKPGKEILNKIFEKYENNKVIIIQPLDDEVKDYYIKYKKPLINLESEAGNFLYYGDENILKNYSIEELGKLFYSFCSIKYFKKIFNMNDNELNELLKRNLNDIKSELIERENILESNISDNIKKIKINETFKFHLDRLKYRNINEILLASNNQTTGGKKIKRKTKKLLKRKTKKVIEKKNQKILKRKTKKY